MRLPMSCSENHNSGPVPRRLAARRAAAARTGGPVAPPRRAQTRSLRRAVRFLPLASRSVKVTR